MVKVKEVLEWSDLMCKLNFMEHGVKLGLIFWAVTYDIECR